MSDFNGGKIVTYTICLDRGKNASETYVIFSETYDTEPVQKSDFFLGQKLFKYGGEKVKNYCEKLLLKKLTNQMKMCKYGIFLFREMFSAYEMWLE